MRLEQQLAALDNDALLGDPVEDAAAATGGHGDGGQLGGMLLDEANGLGDLDPEELAELEGELQVCAHICCKLMSYWFPSLLYRYRSAGLAHSIEACNRLRPARVPNAPSSTHPLQLKDPKPPGRYK